MLEGMTRAFRCIGMGKFKEAADYNIMSLHLYCIIIIVALFGTFVLFFYLRHNVKKNITEGENHDH